MVRRITTEEEKVLEMLKPKKPWEVSDSETESEFDSESEIEETKKENHRNSISIQSPH